MTCTQETRRAFAVLSLAAGGSSVSSGTVKVACEDIPGVGSLRVDADRGRIHVLYDGTATTIARVEHALQMLGVRIQYSQKRAPPMCCAHATLEGRT